MTLAPLRVFLHDRDWETESDAWKAYNRLQEDYAIGVALEKAEKTNKGLAKWASDHYKIGDALEGLKQINDGIIHFAEVDPPYGIDIDKRKSRNTDKDGVNHYTEVPVDEYPEFLKTVAGHLYRVMYENSYVVWWYGMQWHDTVMQTLLDVGFKVNPIPAIWNKNIPGQTASPDTTLGSDRDWET